MTLPQFSLDRAAILSRLGGDQEIFALMIDMYLQDFEGYCTNLSSAMATGQALPLQREAHTVKGLLATFSDDMGSKSAYAIELQAKRGDLTGLEEPVAVLQARLHEVADVLRQETAA